MNSKAYPSGGKDYFLKDSFLKRLGRRLTVLFSLLADLIFGLC